MLVRPLEIARDLAHRPRRQIDAEHAAAEGHGHVGGADREPDRRRQLAEQGPGDHLGHAAPQTLDGDPVGDQHLALAGDVDATRDRDSTRDQHARCARRPRLESVDRAGEEARDQQRVRAEGQVVEAGRQLGEAGARTRLGAHGWGIG